MRGDLCTYHWSPTALCLFLLQWRTPISFLPKGRGSCLTFPSSTRFRTVSRSGQTSRLRAQVSARSRCFSSGRSSRESRDRRLSLSRARRQATGFSLKAFLHHWAFRYLKPPTALKNPFSSDWYAIASVFVYGVRWIWYSIMERTSVMYVRRLVGRKNPVLLRPIDRSWFSLFFALDMRLRQWWCSILSTVIVTPRSSAWVTSSTTSPASVNGSPSFRSAQIIEQLATFQVTSFVLQQYLRYIPGSGSKLHIVCKHDAWVVTVRFLRDHTAWE